MDFYISFSGIITFKNAESLRETVKKIPIENILIETDSPYLAPVPNRGKLNEPSNVRYVAEKIAELKSISIEKLLKLLLIIFLNLFSKCKTTLTILGAGSSAGTPVVGCKCETCLSENPRNTRTRCSSLITLKNGKNILIDTSPDLRQQSLRESITKS